MIVDTTIRLGTVSDLPFVINSWTTAFATTYPNNYAHNFYYRKEPWIKRLAGSSLIVVAHENQDVNDIVSFLVYTAFHQQLVIHYAYTKFNARKQGKVNQLIDFARNGMDVPVIFTHPAKNENAMKFLCSKYIFDPDLVNLLQSTHKEP